MSWEKRWLITTFLFVFALQAVLYAASSPSPTDKEPHNYGPQFSLLVDLISDSPSGLHRRQRRLALDAEPEPVSREAAPKPGRLRSMPTYLEIDAVIDRLSAHYGVDPLLVRLLVDQESGYNPWALSPVGAMGLTQLMPQTAWAMGVNDPWDPEQNLEGGIRYLSIQLDRYQSVELALAAYNAGPGAVDQWGGVPPYPETINYVNSIGGRYRAETSAK